MADSLTNSQFLADFDNYNTQLQTAALKATRNAAVLPVDLGFYRSMDRELAKEVDACSSRVLSLANRLLDLVSTGDTSLSKLKGKAAVEHDDVVDSFRSSVVDAMDRLLERAVSCFVLDSCGFSDLLQDICMDELRGLMKPPAITVKPQTSKQQVCSALFISVYSSHRIIFHK
jgi:exosome complex exonuclease RRP6